MPNETKVIISRVTDYGPKPRSAVAALRQAHAMFQEEGRWVAGAWFTDGDAEAAYEQSSCGSWAACAMGGLGLVTGELPITVTREFDEAQEYEVREAWVDAVALGNTEDSLTDWAREHAEELHVDTYYWDVEQDSPEFDRFVTPLSFRAAQYLAWAIEDKGLDSDDWEDPVDVVVSYNDCGIGRTEVLQKFETAIALAERGKTPKFDDRGFLVQ